MTLRLISLFLACVFLVFNLTAQAPAQSASSYRVYASQIAQNPPDGVVFREDLESYLGQLASSYRKGKRRSALIQDQTLRDAARAQAYDMMLNGKSGHRSRSGLDFKRRFKAFLSADNTVWVSGENAASDRRKGSANKAKAQRLFQSWVNSSGHRRNLLKDQYVYVSTGVVQRGDELWSVQIFWSEPAKTNFIIQ